MSQTEPVNTEMAELLEHSAPCRGWAEQDEGTYHRDIAEDGTGAALPGGTRLACDDGGPLPGVAVDSWRSSGFATPDPAVVTAAAAAPKGEYGPGERSLRARRISDTVGAVEFGLVDSGWQRWQAVRARAIAPTASEALTTDRAVLCLLLAAPAELR